jgi:thiosulfate dehydrogenase [quinone] large subunit
MTEPTNSTTSFQTVSLVVLRTLIGWHFLYEAYYKLNLPGWRSGSGPIAAWTSAAYLKGATGPAAWLFHKLVNAGWTPWIDRAVKITLLLIGLSLILGLFTKVGTWAAFALLSLFYVLYIPTTGMPQPNNEGTYLIVNKTLIEAAAVLVLIAFDTGKLAGLDLFLRNRKRSRIPDSALEIT